MRRSGFVPVLALVLAAMSLVLGGCLGDDDETTTTATTGGDLGLITEGTLTVGSDIPFPPFEQGKAPDYKGYDIDVVNEVAKRLGLEVKYEDTAFDTIFRDLAQGKFDMVASATTITESREERVDFSDPYYEAQQALAVEPGSDIKTTADLGGKTVGAQDGTTGETYAKDETDAKNVRGFPEAADALNALRSGQVDAVIIDEPVVKDAIDKGEGGIEIAEVIQTDELYGFAFQQDSDTLRERVNEVLAEMKGDGTLTGFYEEWFPGTEPTESVLKGTNDQLK
jgi:polar amino acid transport system substrate-binding protein